MASERCKGRRKGMYVSDDRDEAKGVGIEDK